MKKSDFIKLHRDLYVHCKKAIIINNLPSATDPTQDIPVRMINLAANGVPINVVNRTNMVYSNLKVENMTAIDKRHTDVFDALGELQDSAKRVGKVANKFVESKNIVKNENEENN